MTRRGSASGLVRRFEGPAACECTLLVRAGRPSTDPAAQALRAYRTLAERLAAEGGSFGNVVSDTLFCTDVRRDLPVVLRGRAQALREVGQLDAAPLPSFIEQAPLAPAARFAVLATAVVPHQPRGWSVRDVGLSPACPCEGCARTGGRLVRLGGNTTLDTTNLYGAGPDTLAQAHHMFAEADRLLTENGFGFGDVVRTWIHLRDIDRDYDALNQARREFFERRGITTRPASTGIQGGPFPEAHTIALRLTAVRSDAGPAAPTAFSTPSLNEAWSYGADFSRGLRRTDANKTALHVSGTASIDENGRTVHVGDAPAQIDRMLHNVETLLAGQGAKFSDVCSAVTYLKRPADARTLRTRLESRGFTGFPHVVVAAPLCRPDLLCETEAVAVLSLRSPAA